MTQHTLRVSVREALSAHLPSRNDATLIGGLPRVELPAADAFNAHHERFQRELQRWRQRGLGFFAVSAQGLHGWGWAGDGGAFRAVCIGRHSSCTLHLPQHVRLSLRHVLFILGRRSDAWRARVFDLSTRWGFSDERGARLRGLVFDRVAVLEVAGLWLFAMVTGGELPWDPLASNPFATLAPRAPRVTSEDARPRVQGARPEKAPCLACVDGPVSFTSGELVGPGERPDGVLLLQAPGGVARLPVGPRALERGVLLGRDARCSALGFALPSDVSRVHALVVGLNGCAYLADAGSTNQVWRDDLPVRLAPMLSGRRFQLGGHATSVQWIHAH